MEKKKMTKAEAFEWLKCKKVSVSCREISEKVQSKLFDCGVIWKNGGTYFCDYGNYYVINSHGLLAHCDGMGPYWENLINEEITANDILSIEIVEEDNEDKPKMFSDYVAIIQSQLVDDEVVVITKNNYMTMVK